MKTNDLVNILSQTQPPRPMGFAPVLVVVASISFVLVIMTFGVRADLMDSMMNGGFWYKTAFLGTSLVLSLLMLGQSAYPTQRESIVPILYAGLWGGLMIGAAYQIASSAFIGILPQWRSTTGLTCVGFVFLYGLVAQIILIKVMQHFAPRNLEKAGRNIALAAAGAGAIGYSIHCNMDSPAYIIFAYGLPTLLLGLIGAKILPRFIRW